LQLLDFMIDLSPKKIPEHSRAGQYFPDVLPLLKSKETYIDVGAYDGDTLQDFLFETGGHFNKYIALEPDRVNFKKLVKAIPHKYEKKILPLYAAASSKNGYVSIWHGIDNGIDSMISSEGHDKVRSVTIDSICKKERITSIKMDIEGHEPFALRGAGKILKRDKPKLAICVYHQPEHLWSLLLQIKEINPEYSKFYLRHHERERYGTVLYAK